MVEKIGQGDLKVVKKKWFQFNIQRMTKWADFADIGGYFTERPSMRGIIHFDNPELTSMIEKSW